MEGENQELSVSKERKNGWLRWKEFCDSVKWLINWGKRFFLDALPPVAVVLFSIYFFRCLKQEKLYLQIFFFCMFISLRNACQYFLKHRMSIVLACAFFIPIFLRLDKGMTLSFFGALALGYWGFEQYLENEEKKKPKLVIQAQFDGKEQKFLSREIVMYVENRGQGAAYHIHPVFETTDSFVEENYIEQLLPGDKLPFIKFLPYQTSEIRLYQYFNYIKLKGLDYEYDNGRDRIPQKISLFNVFDIEIPNIIDLQLRDWNDLLQGLSKTFSQQKIFSFVYSAVTDKMSETTLYHPYDISARDILEVSRSIVNDDGFYKDLFQKNLNKNYEKLKKGLQEYLRGFESYESSLFFYKIQIPEIFLFQLYLQQHPLTCLSDIETSQFKDPFIRKTFFCLKKYVNLYRPQSIGCIIASYQKALCYSLMGHPPVLLGASYSMQLFANDLKLLFNKYQSSMIDFRTSFFGYLGVFSVNEFFRNIKMYLYPWYRVVDDLWNCEEWVIKLLPHLFLCTQYNDRPYDVCPGWLDTIPIPYQLAILDAIFEESPEYLPAWGTLSDGAKKEWIKLQREWEKEKKKRPVYRLPEQKDIVSKK